MKFKYHTIHDKFPTESKWLKESREYVGHTEFYKNHEEMLKRYAVYGSFPYKTPSGGQLTFNHWTASNRLRTVSMYREMQVFETVFTDEDHAKRVWLEAASLEYVIAKLDYYGISVFLKEVEDGTRKGFYSRTNLRYGMTTIGNMLRCGWLEEAKDLLEHIHYLIPQNAFTDAGETIAIKETEKLILELASETLGIEAKTIVRDPIMNDPEIENARAHWLSDDIEIVEQIFTGLLHRHTHLSHPSKKGVEQDFDYYFLRYNPYEVVSLMRLRQIHGKPNPVIDHRLMRPITGELLEGTRPALAEFEREVVARIIEDAQINEPLLDIALG